MRERPLTCCFCSKTPRNLYIWLRLDSFSLHHNRLDGKSYSLRKRSNTPGSAIPLASPLAMAARSTVIFASYSRSSFSSSRSANHQIGNQPVPLPSRPARPGSPWVLPSHLIASPQTTLLCSRQALNATRPGLRAAFQYLTCTPIVTPLARW